MLLLTFAFEYNLEVQRRIIALRFRFHIILRIILQEKGRFDTVITCHRFLQIMEEYNCELLEDF